MCQYIFFWSFSYVYVLFLKINSHEGRCIPICVQKKACSFTVSGNNQTKQDKIPLGHNQRKWPIDLLYYLLSSFLYLIHKDDEKKRRLTSHPGYLSHYTGNVHKNKIKLMGEKKRKRCTWITHAAESKWSFRKPNCSGTTTTSYKYLSFTHCGGSGGVSRI